MNVLKNDLMCRRFVRLLSLVSLAVLPIAQTQAAVNVLTCHNDNARTGANLAETTLTPSNVNSVGFGKLFTLAADGKVDAQPLIVSGLTIAGGSHNVVYVASEHNTVYAYDADNGAALWQVSVNAGESASDDRGCSNITGTLGVTGTPVIDLSAGPHGTIYVVAMTVTGGTHRQRLHALDLTTGAEQFGGPVIIG